ncbi:MAG: aldehyde dehydrogenase family protein, partial [Gammaproteobacteria bacterium]
MSLPFEQLELRRFIEQVPSMPTALHVVNPFTGEVDRRYAYHGPEDTLERVTQLKMRQREWALLSVAERVERVAKALDYFEQHADVIAQDISCQMGRPVHQARGEIQGLLERGRYMCTIAEATLAAESLPTKQGFDRSIHHAPYGLIYVISAWNYPLLITVNSIVPALIAGNTVLLKHARQTTEIGHHFARAFASVFTAPVLENVVITHELSEALIRNGCVDHVVFTGSVAAGQRILAQCADRVMAPHLELGGKDGVYVDGSVNVSEAAENVVEGACYNAGQSCCGIERAYVHESVYKAFIVEAERRLSAYR